jgi:transposase
MLEIKQEETMAEAVSESPKPIIRRVQPIDPRLMKEIVKWYNRGTTGKEISKHVGVSEPRIWYYLRLAGDRKKRVSNYQRGKLSPKTIATMKQLRKRGLSYSQLAEKFHVSTASVGYWLGINGKAMGGLGYSQRTTANGTATQKHEPIILGNEPLDRQLVEQVVNESWGNLTLAQKLKALGKVL